MKPVRLYTTSYCGFCVRAKEFLAQRAIPFSEIDVTDDDHARAQLVEQTGRRTVPQIFIGDEPIGGYTDLVALERAGKLTPLLQVP